jgi:hypothetical protein
VWWTAFDAGLFEYWAAVGDAFVVVLVFVVVVDDDFEVLDGEQLVEETKP